MAVLRLPGVDVAGGFVAVFFPTPKFPKKGGEKGGTKIILYIINIDPLQNVYYYP